MIINIEVMKRINASVASGSYMPISQLEKECALDGDVLKVVAGDVEKPVTSLNFFFRTISAYLAEMQKRVKMMDECHAAIQKLQIENKIIEATEENPEPAIVWASQPEQA